MQCLDLGFGGGHVTILSQDSCRYRFGASTYSRRHGFPWDEEHRILLVRHETEGPWGLIGGAIEPDEAPEDAARREALEEVGVHVELIGLRGVFGGLAYRVRYPNGDEVAYVSTLFDAKITYGTPTPDQDEVVEARWFTTEELVRLKLNSFTLASFLDSGVIPRSEV
jgi:ADP-ribose pyrophosphatase YjhB (NUDIX family)